LLLFVATTFGGCGFFPGFGILEDPVLYILPVGVAANQVACELQEFMNEQRLLNERETRLDTRRRWRLSDEDAGVKLTLSTDTSGYVNFTGVNVAQIGLQNLVSFIAAQNKVSTLAAKVSGVRSRSVTVSFTVSPDPLPSSFTTLFDPITGKNVLLTDPVTGKPISWNCKQNWRADNPLTSLFLRDWLTSYFENINTLDKNQTFPPATHVTDNIARTIRQVAYPDAIPEQFKVQSVDLSTQFKIAIDVSGGATPNLLGNGSVFILPINGLSLDYSPDYLNKVDITLNMCDSWEEGSPCSGTKNPKVWRPILDKQCDIYAKLAPLLTVKPPREYVGKGPNCTGTCICSKYTGKYGPKPPPLLPNQVQPPA
jgi:hypothetical protein